MLVRFLCMSAFSPSHVLRTAALLRLEEWRPEHIEQWRQSLPEDDRTNFKEFFDNLPRGVKGSTLASYDKSDVEKRFKTDDGRAFAPELYARLQKLKGAPHLSSSPPTSSFLLPPSSFLLPPGY